MARFRNGRGDVPSTRLSTCVANCGSPSPRSGMVKRFCGRITWSSEISIEIIPPVSKCPVCPFKLEKGDLSPLGPAPALGADTDRVLAAIGTPRREAEPNDSLGPAEKPLAGLRVVDFTAFWAGPFAATVLATLGAEVIKVESIQRPDGMRFASGFIPEDGIVWEWAPVFHGANSGKQAITLNLDTDEGLGLAKDLVRQADVVIENFSPRVMERFGLDGPGVEALNPEAILVRMPAFGLSGPWRDRVGFAMTIEQASGLAWVTGFPEREPVVPRGVCDPVGGMTAVFALLAALEKRGQGAGGQQVEVALLEVGLTLAGEQVIEQSAYGVRIDRAGNVGPVSAPRASIHVLISETRKVSDGSRSRWRVTKSGPL